MAFVSHAPQPDGPKPQKKKKILHLRTAVAKKRGDKQTPYVHAICPACGPFEYGFHVCFALITRCVCVRAYVRTYVRMYVALSYLYEDEHGTLVGTATIDVPSPFAPSHPSHRFTYAPAEVWTLTIRKRCFFQLPETRGVDPLPLSIASLRERTHQCMG